MEDDLWTRFYLYMRKSVSRTVSYSFVAILFCSSWCLSNVVTAAIVFLYISAAGITKLLSVNILGPGPQ